MAKNKQFHKYIKDVLSGKEVVNQWVYKAVERHVNDVKKSKDKTYKYMFDEDMANEAIETISQFSQTGKMNKPIELQNYQAFIIGSIFGWVYKKTKYRRFNEVFLFTARKSGKTFLAASLVIYCWLKTEDSDFQGFSLANTVAQAKIAFEALTNIIKNTPMLEGQFKLMKNDIRRKDFGWFKNVASETTGNLDGYNPSCVIVDEFAQAKDRDHLDVMKSGMMQRDEPITFITTTASTMLDGYPAYEMHQISQQLLNGEVELDRFFPVLYQLDNKEEYKDESTWHKANPNKATINHEYLLSEIANGEVSGNMPAVLTKNFNVWVSASDSFITREEWEQHRVSEYTLKDLEGKKIYVGCDFSVTDDLTAVSLITDDGYTWFKVFVPDAKMPAFRAAVDFEKFLKDPRNDIVVTEGKVVDFEVLADFLKYLIDKFDVQCIAYDPAYSIKTISFLDAKEQEYMYKYPQQGRFTNQGIEEIIRMVSKNEIKHNGGTVVNWQLGNLRIRVTETGLKVMEKDKVTKPQRKIDSWAALMMAAGSKVFKEQEDQDNNYDIYNNI